VGHGVGLAEPPHAEGRRVGLPEGGLRMSEIPAGAERVDWDALRAAAVDVAHSAYVPYSHLQVGAAAVVDDGRVITGCNVENASYGLGLCAECTLVGQLRLTGGGRLVALACRS